MITISDIEIIREELLDIFPDAIRGSVSKSNWGKGKRELHLAYFIYSDTVGGYKIIPSLGIYTFISWDTNIGVEWMFAHHDRDEFIEWIRDKFKGEKLKIDRTVTF